MASFLEVRSVGESRLCMSLRYQRGSLRREKRAGGSDVWVWRGLAGGMMKEETGEAADFKSKPANPIAPARTRRSQGIAPFAFRN